jgi:hypothetical protein
MPGRVYTQLLELALERHGYLTPDDARAIGVDPQRLIDLKRRDLAERVARGVYRIPLVPATGLDQYMEATLWPEGVQGVLCHETALDLHDLCDVNPAKIHLTLPAAYRVRRPVPPLYVLYRRDLDERDRTRHEGIPIVTPYRAIVDGIEAGLGPRLIEQAIETATRRGLLRREQLADLKARLEEPERKTPRNKSVIERGGSTSTPASMASPPVASALDPVRAYRPLREPRDRFTTDNSLSSGGEPSSRGGAVGTAPTPPDRSRAVASDAAVRAPLGRVSRSIDSATDHTVPRGRSARARQAGSDDSHYREASPTPTSSSSADNTSVSFRPMRFATTSRPT